MANIGVYDRAFAFIDGALEAQSESVNITFQGDPLPVATMVMEFAGVTPVPKSVKIDVSEFVPSSGSSVKKVTDAFLQTKQVVMRIQFGGSGQTAKYKGFITAPTVTSGAADHTKLNFGFQGEAVPFST